jgi:hypothetical protein
VITLTPEAASPVPALAELGRFTRRSGLRGQTLSSAFTPLKGAEARGSKSTLGGLDGPRNGRVTRPCGLQGPLADRQSRIRGGSSARHVALRSIP